MIFTLLLGSGGAPWGSPAAFILDGGGGWALLLISRPKFTFSPLLLWCLLGKNTPSMDRSSQTEPVTPGSTLGWNTGVCLWGWSGIQSWWVFQGGHSLQMVLGMGVLALITAAGTNSQVLNSNLRWKEKGKRRKQGREAERGWWRRGRCGLHRP